MTNPNKGVMLDHVSTGKLSVCKCQNFREVGLDLTIPPPFSLSLSLTHAPSHSLVLPQPTPPHFFLSTVQHKQVLGNKRPNGHHVGQWAPRLNDYLLTPHTPTCSAKSSPRSCVFLVTRFMDSDQIKKEKRKAVGGVERGWRKGRGGGSCPVGTYLCLEKGRYFSKAARLLHTAY